MAKKKSTKKKTGTKRKMSGIGKIDIGSQIMDDLALLGGAILGKVAMNKLQGKADDKILAGGTYGAGLAVPFFVKQPMIRKAAQGMRVVGALSLLSNFGVLQGLGAADDPYIMLNGAYDRTAPGSGVGAPAGDYVGDTSYVGDASYVGAVQEELYY